MKRINMILLFTLYISINSWAQNRPMIIKVKIKKNEKFTIYTNQKYSNYDFIVDWGDGSPKQNHLAKTITHTYQSSGSYLVSIWGKYPSIFFSAFYRMMIPPERHLITVKQWGDNQWQSMEHMFRHCTQLKNIDAKDTPNLKKVKSLAYMFARAKKFNGNINHWDVSNIRNMSSMFERAKSFNQPLNQWDVRKVKNMSSMFANAEAFNKPLNQWNLKSAETLESMFANAEAFNKPLNDWNLKQVNEMQGMFEGASNFNQPLDKWDVSHIQYMDDMFYDASSFNQDISHWKMDNALKEGIGEDFCKNSPLTCNKLPKKLVALGNIVCK